MMINIFSGTFSETMTIKNLLESKNVNVFAANELMSNIEPTISAGGFDPVILKVSDEDFELAQKIIEDYQNGNLSLEN
jgi:hypothetical protein